MSAHGISPAWKSRGNGLADHFIIGFRGLELLCDIAFIPDIGVSNSLIQTNFATIGSNMLATNGMEAVAGVVVT